MKSQHLASIGVIMKSSKEPMVEGTMLMERMMDGELSIANVHVCSLNRCMIYLISHLSSSPGPTTNKRTELPVAQQPPEDLTKKQRQNANKREAQKSTKAAAESERLAVLAKHKRELERIRIMEQSQSSKKGKTSGGMTSVVDDRGKLVWE